MTTGPLLAPSKCKSGLPRITRACPGWWKQSFRLRLWSLVWFKWGHIMPLHIFEVGLKVNTKVYLDMLKSVVIPWCHQLAGSRPWVWQQDSAPAHKSKETQAWLQKECYDFVPFSYCPFLTDLNPLDYFIWSYVENITNMTFQRYPWCSRYRRRKWTRRYEFKSWTKLIAFHIALIPLGKVWIQLFSLQLWVNSRID